MPPDAVQEFMRQLKEDGYFQQSADWGVDLKLMANTARALSQADLPPVFAFLYDEFWYPFFRLRLLYEGLLGGLHPAELLGLECRPEKGRFRVGAAP